jgi:hypothetical protein
MFLDRSAFEDERGYLRFSDTGRLVHRAIAERSIGRRLRSFEVVHHVDMDKKNNDPSNLRICRDQTEHERLYHRKYRYRQVWRRGFIRTIIYLCLALFVLLLFLIWISPLLIQAEIALKIS